MLIVLTVPLLIVLTLAAVLGLLLVATDAQSLRDADDELE